MGDHARLSPSASKRWMTCTGSLALEPTLSNTSSPFAQHGTMLHTVSENCLRGSSNPDLPDKKDTEIVQFYIDYVRDLRDVAGGKGELYIEQKLRYTADLWGTADAVLIQDGQIDVIDLKGGSGVKVSAWNNTQFLIYALMARKEFEPIYGPGAFKEIRMHCVQPAIDHVDVWEIPAIQLDAFEEELILILDRIANGERKYVPSEEACRFCRGKAVCRARAEQNFAIAVEQMALADPPALTLDEIAALLPKLGQIASWTKAIEEYALAEALTGQEIPGHKLVSGRSVRVWKSEESAAIALSLSGVPDESLYNRKLIGLGAAEKLLGKTHKVFTEQTIKAEGKPTLVPNTDKRDAIISSSTAAVAEMSEV